ncbi:MAG: CotH kinase family protein [Clostridia bacterium]|nr:CotH kinase family protein [Clostridia bacterium]
MLKSKAIDRIGCIALAVMLALTCVVWAGKASAGRQTTVTVGYEGLFDQSYVHTIDIEMDDWDTFIANATQEAYTECNVTIDGEKISNVGIRGKGNTSLSSVSSMGSQKYSFKIEFNQYVKGKTYKGLDKLSLNNLIYDSTMMKDYLAYTLMARAGVPSPLCSYIQVTVNGEPWGLYLAVEGVEDGFMERNNMTTGELYKPDSMSFGGGRGNGRDFDFDQFRVKEDEDEAGSESTETGGGETAAQQPQTQQDDFGGSSGASFGGQMPEGFSMPEGMTVPENGQGFSMPEGMTLPEGFQAPESTEETADSSDRRGPGGFEMPTNMNFNIGGGMFNFGMGSSDVKLQYIDDDPDSYSNIFNNAKTDVSKRDKARLIETLKTLNSDSAQDAVYTDEVISYLAVHDFLQNGDSYTGMMVHNYYLYEEDGKLAIIPWDYNLAFGGMSGADASSTVNSPIDNPVSNGTGTDRPLISWILTDEEALEKYHAVYSQFIADTVESGWLAGEITRVSEMIRSYVEADENSFYTVEEFDTGIENLQAYCALRGESVRGQLEGTIPSTSSGQRADSSALVDPGDLSISAMGSMNSGNGGGGFGGGGFGGGMPSMPSGGFSMPSGTQMPTQGGTEGQTSENPFGGSDGGQSSGAPAAQQDTAAGADGQFPGSQGSPAGTEEQGKTTDAQAETGETVTQTAETESQAEPAETEDPAKSGDARTDSGRSRGGFNREDFNFDPNFQASQANSGMSWVTFGIYAAALILAILLVARAPGKEN